MSWLPSRTGKRKSESGPLGGVEKLARGVRELTIEDEPTDSSPSTLAAGFFEDDAVVVDGDALDAPELSASGTAEHTAAGQIPNAQPAQPADMVDVDHPDALEPLATGTAENSAAGQIPIAKQAQPADMAPEVSDGVQGAPTEILDLLERLNGMDEEGLQRELMEVKAAIDKANAALQDLELVQGLLRATEPSIKRTIAEARARAMKLSQLQFRLIKYQRWKANFTPMPCFDHQVAGAAHHLWQELLSTMEATSMEAVDQALGELGCPGSLNMDCDIIRRWVEETMDERQQYCVELATLESDLMEAEERDFTLRGDLHHLHIQLNAINRLLFDLQVQSIVPALSAMGNNPRCDVP